MTFAEDRARVDRAAATLFYRHEYIAAMELLGLQRPAWRDLSLSQQVRIMHVLDAARRVDLSCRAHLARELIFSNGIGHIHG